MAEHLLTFELTADGEELHVHGDAKGLTLLARAVTLLAAQCEAGAADHTHLATEAWGSSELSSDRQSDASRLVNQVTIHARPATGKARP